VTARDAAAFESHPDQYIAAERFRHPKPFAHRVTRIDRDPNRACGQTSQDLIDQGEALLDLANAHPDAGVDVTGLEHRNLEIEPIVGRIAGHLARIEGAAAGTPDITAGAELPCQLAA